MDSENIVRLAQEMQNLLPFGPDATMTEDQYLEVIALIDQLTKDSDTYNKNWALLEVLVPVVTAYDENE